MSKSYFIEDWELQDLRIPNGSEKYQIAKLLKDKGMLFINQFEPSFAVTPIPSGKVRVSTDFSTRKTTYTQVI